MMSTRAQLNRQMAVPVVNTPVINTLDKVLNLTTFESIYSSFTNKSLRNSIRLIRIFGTSSPPKGKGVKMIFITNEDKAYSIGYNGDGSLGLGHMEPESWYGVITMPTLSEGLSGKQLVDIAPGFGHCLGLTSGGHCYAWGQNEFGQLGIGNTDETRSPQLVTELANVVLTQISCGAYHSMALTSNGKVFIWGDNYHNLSFGSTNKIIIIPTEVLMKEKVASISCGGSHVMAVSEMGRVFVWGNNKSGQLGQKFKDEITDNQIKPMEGFDNISKAVCGPNHSLILTSDGNVYAFGDNTYGQIGNGSLNHQYIPHKLNFYVRIKDILTNFEREISIAVSIDNQCFVWGLGSVRPHAIQMSPERYLFEICWEYSINRLIPQTSYDKRGDPFQRTVRPGYEMNESQSHHNALLPMMRWRSSSRSSWASTYARRAVPPNLFI